MSRQHSYYTLIASLPWLPRFDQTESLPISEKRLTERLRMLQAEDALVVERGMAFLAWRQHPTERRDREMIERYQKMMAVIKHHTLRELVAFASDLRTIMAALRHRQRGMPAPTPGEPWGVGQWVRYIERHWDVPDFKLSTMHPWIPQARTYLEQEETLTLERFLMNQRWDHVDRSIQGNDFGFESVLAYLFKWSILKQWLSHDTEAAKARFEDLVSEVMHEHQQLFN